jgi:hypothetical protein
VKSIFIRNHAHEVLQQLCIRLDLPITEVASLAMEFAEFAVCSFTSYCEDLPKGL